MKNCIQNIEENITIKSTGKDTNKKKEDYLESNKDFDPNKNFQILKEHEILLNTIKEKVDYNRKTYKMDEADEEENERTKFFIQFQFNLKKWF